jgi:hypothetical protein
MLRRTSPPAWRGVLPAFEEEQVTLGLVARAFRLPTAAATLSFRFRGRDFTSTITTKTSPPPTRIH